MSMNFYSTGDATAIDLRTELHSLIYGRVDITPQGKQVVLRRMLDQTCPTCWDPKAGASTRPDCPYCDGEGFMWSETLENMFIAHGVAPIYKPGILGTGQYPQGDYGYTDPGKASIYAEYSVYPNYEKYTLQVNPAYDKLFELKVDAYGNTVFPHTRSAVWKLLSVTPIFGDYGRVEYFELGAEKVNI
jgi:hypothetical protein